MNIFSTWLHEFDARISEIEEINKDDVNNALQSIHLFVQEHTEKESALMSIKNKLFTTLGENVPDNNPILVQYKNVEKKYKV